LQADRKNAHYAGLALMPGYKSRPTDVRLVCFTHQLASIPEVGFRVSKLPELVYETKGIYLVSYGRVGNGEFRTGRRFSSKPYSDVVVGIFHVQLLSNSDNDTAKAKERFKGMVKMCHCT